MKKLLLFLLLTVSVSAFALTKISVQNGLWNDPNTWSPFGVPQPGDDTIIVATDVAFVGHNVYFGMSYFEVASSGQLNGGPGDTLTFGGDVLMINGYTQADVFITGANDSAVNNAQIEALDFIQSGTFINNMWICIGAQLTTSDDFINNGSVKCDTWINSAIVNGTQGQFCIAQNFINSDQISGNIDICDATPGGFGDIDMGTISGSVTYCAVGPCAGCAVPGIGENNILTTISIVPHPVSDISMISFESELLQPNQVTGFVITDVQGRVILSTTVFGTQFYLDRSGIENGLYFYTLTQQGKVLTTGKLLIL